MYAAKLLTVLLIILAVVVAYSPQAREQAGKAWEEIGPTVIGMTDNLYVTVRNLITGAGVGDGLDETPVPGSGGDFERIVTLHNSFDL